MAREDTPMLEKGDIFPPMDFSLITGETENVPSDYRGKWVVLLFLRGYW